MGEVTSWAKKQIALMQLDTQEAAVKTALLRVEINLRPESDAKTWRLYDELKQELAYLREARKEVKSMETKPKRRWSELVVKLYAWATKERFTF